MDPKSLKAYHTMRAVWAMGEGAPAGFVHCTIMMLEGRDFTLRRKISDGVADLLKDAFAHSLESGEAGLTVEIRVMDPDCYFK